MGISMNQKVMIWGSGNIATNIFNQCMTLDEYDIIAIVDSAKEKHGQYFFGNLIISPLELPYFDFDIIVIASDSFDSIYQQISFLYPEYLSRVKNKNYFYKCSLISRYKDNKDPEIQHQIRYIEENGLEIFNYDFKNKYKNLKIDTYYDDEKQLYYVLHKGRKLYFSREYDSPKKVTDYYRGLLIEQDKDSPHCYENESYYVEDGDVVVDCGVAEGNFALDIIDKAAKVYLLEADSRWIEALQATFDGYADKVVIIQTFLSSYIEGSISTIDSLIEEPVNYIKMDIEGSEWDALLGAKKTISKSNKLKMSICCYHSDFDQILIENVLDTYGIQHEISQGYMWFPYLYRQTVVSTRLNRALIRAKK